MSTLTDFFTSLANKIRSKTGSSAAMTPFEMVDAIDDIATPLQTKTVTAGTSATTVTPDTGYALSSVTVNPTPSQTKTVTAGTSATTVTSDSGYYLSSVAVNPTPSQTKSATPSTSAQTISPDSGKLLSSVTVNAITPNLSTQSRYQHASNNTSPTLIGDAGYFTTVYDNVSKTNVGAYYEIRFNGSKDKNNNTMKAGWMNSNTLLAIPSQTKTITATTSAQTVYPDSDKVLQSVTVNPQSHSGTYTFAANDTGGTKDLGTTHGYRYVNASNVYTYGRLHPSVSAVTNSSYVNVNGITTRSMSGFTSGVRYMIVLYNASGSITWAEAQKIKGATLGSGGTDIDNISFWIAGTSDTRFACRGIIFTATSTSVSINFSSALGNYTVVFLSLKLS